MLRVLDSLLNDLRFLVIRRNLLGRANGTPSELDLFGVGRAGGWEVDSGPGGAGVIAAAVGATSGGAGVNGGADAAGGVLVVGLGTSAIGTFNVVNSGVLGTVVYLSSRVVSGISLRPVTSVLSVQRVHHAMQGKGRGKDWGQRRVGQRSEARACPGLADAA